MRYEVEQKFPVADRARLEEQLAALGARIEPACLQVDQYFAHPGRDFANTDEALRIRRVGDANYLTYKGPKLDKTTKTRREIEIPVAPGAAVAADCEALLLALGFSRVADVRKQRRRVEIPWQARSIEGALDDVTDVGKFIELELIADEAGLAAATQCVTSLAARLGLGPGERRSYLELLLAAKNSI